MARITASEIEKLSEMSHPAKFEKFKKMLEEHTSEEPGDNKPIVIVFPEEMSYLKNKKLKIPKLLEDFR